MSRLAQFCLTLFRRLYHLTSTRPLILFGLALALACLSANGEATAQILFQSPESPIGPGFGSPQIDPAAAPQEPAPVAPEQPAGDSSTLPTSTPAAPEQAGTEPGPPQPAPSSRRGEEDRFADDETEGDSNFILDQAEFIDTVVVSTAYVWLCCGIILLLLIPLAALFLQIRGRTKISREEPY